jgi:4,5:9,10-diseco-3-hydroxy-5,9,17-trioxoandrosta-1(10),2-diene-4-oate hydrolase
MLISAPVGAHDAGRIRGSIAMEGGRLARWDTGVPEGSPMVAVGGMRLAVDDRGSGQPVICLHAIAHGSADFDAFAAAASARFRVIRIDWPGQGRSDADDAEPSPARYADLVRGIVLHLGLADPILLGCSIGGAAAIDYASRFGARALVLANPGGLIEPSDRVSAACRKMSRFFASGSRGAWWFGPAYRLYYRLVLPQPAASLQRRRIVRAGFENAVLLAKAWSVFAIPAKADQRAAAQSLDIPVLFTWAMHDRINPFARSASAIAKMKRARVVKFNSGHAAFLEQPRQFTAEFCRFVDALDAGRDVGPARSAKPKQNEVSILEEQS